MRSNVLSILAVALSLAGCKESFKINVPSDPNAIYFDEGTFRQENGFIQIWTQRSSSEGFSHAVRVVDCERKAFEYIYDNDKKPEEFPIGNQVHPSGQLVDESISYWVSGYACKKHGFSVADW